MLTPAGLAEFREAVDTASKANPSGLVLLSAFRLDERFPLQFDFDADRETLAETLRAVDQKLNAIASVLEFGGVRAAAMRIASRAVWALARPSAKMGIFDSLTDAALWLSPHAREVDAPDELAAMVRTYRHADRALARFDARA